MDPTFALRDFECGQNYDPEHPMSRACAEFLFSALALRQEYAELESSYVKLRAQSEGEFQAYRAEPANYDSVSARGARLPFDAPPIKQPPFLAVWRAQRIATAVEEQFRRHMLVALMSAYDRFLGDLLRAAYKLRPELLDRSARDLRWRDIKDYHSVEEVLGLVIEREVEVLIHETRVGQWKWLANRLNLPDVNIVGEDQHAFVEIAERRNLFAHTGGRVSARYISACCPDLSRAPEKGSYLSTTIEYFTHACETMIRVAVKLTQATWRTIGGRLELPAADRDLSQITYMFLAAEEWQLAQTLLKYAGAVKHSSEQHQLVFLINHAQTFKWQGNQQACDSLLNKTEWASRDVAFQLSKAVLTDQFDEAADLMRYAGSSKQIQRSAFDHWPIYRRFRETPQYRETYQDIYGVPAPSGSEAAS